MAKMITNMNELAADIQKRINSNDKSVLKSLKTKSGETFEHVSRQQLREAAEALEDYLNDWINVYYFSYVPRVYERTYRFRDSVRSVVESNNGQLQARVFFHDNGGGVWRDSFTGKSEYHGYLPELLNDGWSVGEDIKFRDTYHVGWYEGFNFIQAAVAEAKRDPRFKNIEIKADLNSPF